MSGSVQVNQLARVLGQCLVILIKLVFSQLQNITLTEELSHYISAACLTFLHVHIVFYLPMCLYILHSSSASLSARVHFSVWLERTVIPKSEPVVCVEKNETVTTSLLICQLSLTSPIEVCSGEINMSEPWQAGRPTGR